jgi:uncharacterized protein YbcI
MTPADTPRTGGEVFSRVSTALVGLHKEYYGKGPTKAKTFLVDDTLVCLLHGGLTVVEKTLIAAGRAGAVHDVRQSFQAAMKEPFIRLVEEVTGRKVVAYLSSIHTDPDIAAEIFVLEPTGAPLGVGAWEERLEP